MPSIRASSVASQRHSWWPRLGICRTSDASGCSCTCLGRRGAPAWMRQVRGIGRSSDWLHGRAAALWTSVATLGAPSLQSWWRGTSQQIFDFFACRSCNHPCMDSTCCSNAAIVGDDDDAWNAVHGGEVIGDVRRLSVWKTWKL